MTSQIKRLLLLCVCARSGESFDNHRRPRDATHTKKKKGSLSVGVRRLPEAHEHTDALVDDLCGPVADLGLDRRVHQAGVSRDRSERREEFLVTSTALCQVFTHLLNPGWFGASLPLAVTEDRGFLYRK